VERHVVECTRKTTLSDARMPETAAVLVAGVPTVTVLAAVTIITQRVNKDQIAQQGQVARQIYRC
jgi:hypothetical protein